MKTIRLFKFSLISLLVLVLGCQESEEKPKIIQKEPTVEPIVEQEAVPDLPQKPTEPSLVSRYDSTVWTNILDLDKTVVLDIRYATDSNFVKEKMYPCAACFLRPEVAKAIVKVHQNLQKQGYGGLKLFDCYRPLPIQQKLWNKMPDARFVMSPKKGSMHNRGTAVDLTIVDSTGKELDMGTPFDFFGKEAYHTYTALPQTVLSNRKLLKQSLAAAGFKHIRTEWWHYSYVKRQYALSRWEWECR
jgi:D-alanyl-D-alanine dipeptidase